MSSLCLCLFFIFKSDFCKLNVVNLAITPWWLRHDAYDCTVWVCSQLRSLEECVCERVCVCAHIKTVKLQAWLSAGKHGGLLLTWLLLVVNMVQSTRCLMASRRFKSSTNLRPIRVRR